MEYNYHKSVTIPGQTMPLRELMHRFTNGVPISDNLERQGTYDWSQPFSPSNMPTDEDFSVGHDANEIDITIAESKARKAKEFIAKAKKNPETTKPSNEFEESQNQQSE